MWRPLAVPWWDMLQLVLRSLPTWCNREYEMTALSADAICREHLIGRPHPERPERFDAGYRYLSTGDTEIDGRSWEVAVRAVGGVLNAVDAVMAGHTRNAFCVVRPPGHHANAGRGMGFCILNTVALAARY